MKNRNSILVATLVALGFFALWSAPKAFGVVPPPDGGYPNFNTAEGQKALFSLTTGQWNTALGAFTLWKNTDGSFNTAVGTAALLLNTIGSQNTAVGVGALLNNTEGGFNTATGNFALSSNTTGFGNTATGARALQNNTTGVDNTANGFEALARNTDGDSNTAEGRSALLNNTTGSNNTAGGNNALVRNITGNFNTANGSFALAFNDAGNNNTAIGDNALGLSTTGNNNTAIGDSALANNTTGSGNTALSALAGTAITTADNTICIGTAGVNVSNSCFIGQVYSNAQPIVGTDPDSVTITSAGRLGRGNVSSRRYKHEIKPMDKASEVLYALKPVSFRYNKEYDATQTLAFGLIAEEVAQVYPDLVGRNPKGQPESVRYEQINAMLLNEFLKEHRKVEEREAAISRLNATVARQEATGAEQQKEIQALRAGLQKVSAQIETSKFATGPIRRGGVAANIALNNH